MSFKFEGKLTGNQKLFKGFSKLPDRTFEHIEKAIRKSVDEGVRMARVLAPVGSGKPDPELGRLKDGIHGKFVKRDDIIMGSVEAAPPNKEAQIKARAVEFGRKQSRVGLGTRLKGTPSRTGTTNPHPFITRAKELLEDKHKRRIRSGIRKAIKETVGGK